MAVKTMKRAEPMDPEEIAELREGLEGLEDELVDSASMNMALPLITGGRVIYLGNQPHYSTTLKGHVTREVVEDADDPSGKVVIKSCEPDLHTPYDFSDRDNRKRKIMVNRYPEGGGVPGVVAGRRWVSCEHPEHLRQFQRGEVVGRESQNEKLRMFKLVVPLNVRPIWLEYVARVERWKKAKSGQMAETISA